MARSEYLANAACHVGCSDCVRSCAMARIKAVWWGEELKRLVEQMPAPQSPERPEWHERVAEAQGHLSRLALDIRGERPMRRERPKLRLIQGGKN